MNAVQILTTKTPLRVKDLYNPLIEYALEGRKKEAEEHIKAITFYTKKFNNNIDEEGIQKMICLNLDYYCQYFSTETMKKVKSFYGLGDGYRDLFGVKHGQDLTRQEIFNLGVKYGEYLNKKIKNNI